MTELEKLAKTIMIECEKDGESVTLEEATEMAKMELKSKQVKRYEQSDKPRKKSTRERKIDETKKHLINSCKVLLEGLGATVEPLKTEAEMHFIYQNENYTIKLIKHRPKK